MAIWRWLTAGLGRFPLVAPAFRAWPPARRAQRAAAIGALALCFSVSGVLTTSAADVTSTWQGGTGNWSNPSGWDSAEFPDNGNGGFTYDAVIGAGNVAVDQDVTIEGLTLSGGILTGPAGFTLTVNESMTWTGGFVTGAGTTVIGPDATLLLSESSTDRHLRRLLVNKGTTTWTGGNLNFMTLQSNGTFQNDGLFIASPGGGASFNSFSSGSTNTFQNNGTFIKQGMDSASFSYISSNGGVTFNNAGTVDVQQGTLYLASGGTHTGDFQLASGATLELLGTHSFDATSEITGPGTLTVGGTILYAGQVSFAGQLSPTGTLALRSGTFSVNSTTSTGTLDFPDFSNATLTGPADSTLIVNESMTWMSGTMAGEGTTVIGPDATLTLVGHASKHLRRLLVNEGTTTLTGGTLALQNGAFQNEGLFTASSVNSLHIGSNSAGSVSTFQNNGAFVQRGPGTVTSSYDVTFNNAGTVDVEQGTMSLYGSGTHTGSFHLANGAKLELRWTQNFTASSQITGPGTLIVRGQTIFDGQLSPTGTVALGSFAFNLSSTTSTGVLELSDGRLNGLDDSALTVNEEMNWQGGTLMGTGTTVIGPDATLTLGATSGTLRHLHSLLVNEGTATWTSGSLAFQNGTFQNDGLFTASSNSPLTVSSSSSGSVNMFQNNGTFTKEGSTTVTFSSVRDGVTFDNSGTVDVQQGTLDLQGAITQLSDSTLTGGTWIVRSGATLTFSDERNVLVNEANVELGGPSASFPAIDSISENVGRFSIVGGREFITAGDFHNLGELNIGEQSSLSVNGNYQQDVEASLTIRLEGESAGEPDGPISIAGTAMLSGLLKVLPADLGGELFRPQVGETFILLSAANGLEGTTFNLIDLPTRIGGFDYEWTTTYSDYDVTIEVAATSLSGDFNRDGTVDAADYVVWRNGLGSEFTIDDYTTWKQNYGATALGGGAIADQIQGAKVPEPGTLALIALTVAFTLASRYKVRQQHGGGGFCRQGGASPSGRCLRDGFSCVSALPRQTGLCISASLRSV